MKYKWKDKVRIKSKKELECISEVTNDMLKNAGAIMTIACLVEDADAYIMKEDGDFHFLWSDEMIEGLVEEEVGLVDNLSSRWVNEFNLPEGYIFKDENGNVINATKIVLEKKKKEYPKTYEECCEILKGEFIQDDIGECYVAGYFAYELECFQKLLICRDAYWKIAGEEMGLGKPWEPDWNTSEPKYVIACTSNGVEKQWEATYCKGFAFPTEEMRDAFYENFKELIEMCKELL